jgi:ribosomal-protein-alanine N-acetyltransferase
MVRKSTAMDAQDVQRILDSSPEAAQWTVSLQSVTESSSIHVLVSERAGEVVGLIAFRAVADEAEILNLAVLQAWRRCGLGRELMSAAIMQSRELGARRIFLEVRESNAGARAFYSRMQFTEHGRRSGYYRAPCEDAIVFARTIDVI